MSLLLYMARSKAYGFVAVAMAVMGIFGTLVVLWLGGQVEALAWTQTGVTVLGAVLSWVLAVRLQPSCRPP